MAEDGHGDVPGGSLGGAAAAPDVDVGGHVGVSPPVLDAGRVASVSVLGTLHPGQGRDVLARVGPGQDRLVGRAGQLDGEDVRLGVAALDERRDLRVPRPVVLVDTPEHVQGSVLHRGDEVVEVVVELDRVDRVLALPPRLDLVDHRLDEALHAVEVHRDVRGVGDVEALALVAKLHKATFSLF